MHLRIVFMLPIDIPGLVILIQIHVGMALQEMKKTTITHRVFAKLTGDQGEVEVLRHGREQLSRYLLMREEDRENETAFSLAQVEM